MRIGVTGPNGRVGTQLVKMGCIPLGCNVLDISDITSEISRKKPDVIIHCAGKDAPYCQVNPQVASEVILRGSNNVRWSFEGRIIHLSSMYVFPGKAMGHYRENSQPEPINTYGMLKHASELLFRSYADRESIIVRPSVLYGDWQRPSMVERVVHEFQTQSEVRLATNVYRNFTYVPHFCKALIQLATMSNPPSVVHLADLDITSQVVFGGILADTFGFNIDKIRPYTNNDPIIPKNLGVVRSGMGKGLPYDTLEDGLKELRSTWEKLAA